MTDDIAFHEKRLVYRIPGDAQVHVRRDLTYRTVDGAGLKMDVYLPEGISGDDRLPCVLFIHGGPIAADFRPRLKDWGQYRSYGELIAASGLIAVTFNHRFFGFSHLRDSAEDIASAIDYVQDKGETLGVDGDRMALWAISGGGPFLAPVLRRQPQFVRCVVAYYAILDPGESEDVSAVLPEEELKRFSLVHYLKSSGALELPYFIARVGQDFPEFNRSIDRFIGVALAANMTLDVVNHPQGRHGFDLLDDDDRSQYIVERTIAFIKTNLV